MLWHWDGSTGKTSDRLGVKQDEAVRQRCLLLIRFTGIAKGPLDESGQLRRWLRGRLGKQKGCHFRIFQCQGAVHDIGMAAYSNVLGRYETYSVPGRHKSHHHFQRSCAFCDDRINRSRTQNALDLSAVAFTKFGVAHDDRIARKLFEIYEPPG